jgi:hypothetical protein
LIDLIRQTLQAQSSQIYKEAHNEGFMECARMWEEKGWASDKAKDLWRSNLVKEIEGLKVEDLTKFSTHGFNIALETVINLINNSK